MDLTERPSRTASAPRLVGWLALAGVSLIAGIASYFHALAVVQAAGATAPVSYLVPALADLVILGASADLLAASRSNQPRPALTMTTLAVGVGVTLAMNVAAGGGHGLGGRLVSGWPALAFTLALESLAGLVRRGRDGSPRSPVPAASSQPEPAAPLTTETALRALVGTASERALADALGVPRSRVQAWKSQQADAVAAAALNGSGPHVP